MEEKKQGIAYFNFFGKYFLPIYIVLRIIGLAPNISNYQYVDSDLLFLFVLEIIIYIILYIAAPIFLCDKFLGKKESYPILLIIWQGINWLYLGLISAIRSLGDNLDFTSSFIVALILLGLWFIPNIIYNFNRLDIFDDTEEDDEDDDENITKDNSNNIIPTEESKTIDNNSNNSSQINTSDVQIGKNFCTHCGIKINENWIYCNNCGNKLK